MRSQLRGLSLLPSAGSLATYDGKRLIAVDQFRKANDCCIPKQSLHQDFREGQLYPLKLPVESEHRQVTALVCADLVLSTHCGRSQCGRSMPAFQDRHT